MPEGDTIFRTARTLQRALAGHRVTGFETMLPRLARVDEDAPIAGRTVEAVTSSGKWLMIRFSPVDALAHITPGPATLEVSGPLVLLTHMLMSGSWHIYRPGERWHRRRDDMRIVIATEQIIAVAFTVPVAEFHTEASLARRPGFSRLGLDVLAPEFDEVAAVAALRSRPELQVGDALMDQSLLAGVGNVFKSEICFACDVHPFRPVASLTDAEVAALVRSARRFLKANVTHSAGGQIVTYSGQRRTTNRSDPSASLWVYGRRGEPCRKCGGIILMQKQGAGARVTFWCPQCQKA